MAYNNAIELAKAYVPVLDAVYKAASLTAKLDGNPDLVRAGANANELCIPMISMDGLANYSRNGGYVDGAVSLVYETKQCNFDRGRLFQTDVLDNLETAGVAFGQLAGEFIRTKVVPEEDAFRFASYAGYSYTPAGGSAQTPTTVAANLSTGADVIAALATAADAMTDAEVPEEDRHLFITPTLYGLVRDLDTTKSKAVLDSFASITKVPQSRFYSAIEQLDGTSSGETAGGYAKATGAKDLNFMVIHKAAVIQFPKHVAPKVITPEANQKADAYAFGYRKVGIASVYANKIAGIYVHTKA